MYRNRITKVIQENNNRKDHANRRELLEQMKRVIAEAKQAQKQVKQPIKAQNFRTVPCRNYHGQQQGCSRGDSCHYIHAQGFEGTLFFLPGLKKVNPLWLCY